MNLVLDDAEEVSVKRKTRKPVGEPSMWLGISQQLANAW